MKKEVFTFEASGIFRTWLAAGRDKLQNFEVHLYISAI